MVGFEDEVEIDFFPTVSLDNYKDVDIIVKQEILHKIFYIRKLKLVRSHEAKNMSKLYNPSPSETEIAAAVIVTRIVFHQWKN